jgi:DNA methylase
VLNLSGEAVERLSLAVADRRHVKGATHQFYRYPARFSPQFARAFIEEFTKPGELVVDPFVGGGTTLVEAMLLGRNAIGSDINSLAAFISQVKTTPLSDGELDRLESWIGSLSLEAPTDQTNLTDNKWAAAGYFKNIDDQETLGYQKIVQAAIDQTHLLPNEKCSDFARCAILRTAQLALDGKKTIPPTSEFQRNLNKNFSLMISDMRSVEFGQNAHSKGTTIRVINGSAANIHEHEVFQAAGSPKLILTSPPYPGVHVLYHRWQVRGRRETAAPYWIANKLDGDGERYYTLGNRHEMELRGYFENLAHAFNSISKLADQETIIIQMVAFSEPDWQLEKYLDVMKGCGLREVNLQSSEGMGTNSPALRLWRDVPNRKWHAGLQQKRAGSREVVLCHRKA